jgi:hypothetical protein
VARISLGFAEELGEQAADYVETAQSVSRMSTPLRKNIPTSLFPQITCLFPAVSSHRGAARDRHGRGAGCGGRGLIRRGYVIAGQAKSL